MKTPKMLPWLARKAGISDALADELWADAIRYATQTTGGVGTPQYWKVAADRLVELIDAERQVRPRIEAERASVRNRGRWPFALIVQMKNAPSGETLPDAVGRLDPVQGPEFATHI